MEPDVHKEVNMTMEGDGLNGQPSEGVATLSGLSALLDEGEEAIEGEDAPAEEEEGEEAPAEAEGEEGEETEEAPEEEAEEDATVVLKHDGKEVTLKQSEVVELAQKGFDYTQKTMALAEDRKAVEAERTKAAESRKQYEATLNDSVNRLQALTDFMSSTLGTPPPVDLAQRDVALYIAQKEQYEARKGQLAEAQQAVQRLQEEQARSRQAWIAQKSAETEAALKNTLSGWNESTLNELIDYAGKHGLGESSFDHAMLEKGFWELAHKAKAYDELMEKKAQLKPVSKLPKVAPPATRTQPPQLAKRQAAHKQYREKPSLQTLADLID